MWNVLCRKHWYTETTNFPFRRKNHSIVFTIFTKLFIIFISLNQQYNFSWILVLLFRFAYVCTYIVICGFLQYSTQQCTNTCIRLVQQLYLFLLLILYRQTIIAYFIVYWTKWKERRTCKTDYIDVRFWHITCPLQERILVFMCIQDKVSINLVFVVAFYCSILNSNVVFLAISWIFTWHKIIDM